MTITKKEQIGNKVCLTIEMDSKLAGTMLELENQIATVVNGVGLSLTEEALKQQDTSGAPIRVNGHSYTSKGEKKKSLKRCMAK